VSAIASAVDSAVKFVNSFARCQHLFDVAAKPINNNNNNNNQYIYKQRQSHDWRRFEFSLVFCSLVPIPISPKMLSFNLFVVMITFREFHRNPFSVLVKQRNIFGAGRKTGRSTSPVQHRLWRHKNPQLRKYYRVVINVARYYTGFSEAQNLTPCPFFGLAFDDGWRYRHRKGRSSVRMIDLYRHAGISVPGQKETREQRAITAHDIFQLFLIASRLGLLLYISVFLSYFYFVVFFSYICIICRPSWTANKYYYTACSKKSKLFDVWW